MSHLDKCFERNNGMRDLRVAMLNGEGRQDLPKEGALKTLELSKFAILNQSPSANQLSSRSLLETRTSFGGMLMADNTLFLSIVHYLYFQGTLNLFLIKKSDE